MENYELNVMNYDFRIANFGDHFRAVATDESGMTVFSYLTDSCDKLLNHAEQYLRSLLSDKDRTRRFSVSLESGIFFGSKIETPSEERRKILKSMQNLFEKSSQLDLEPRHVQLQFI